MPTKSKFLKDARICFSLTHYDGFCSGVCEYNGKYLYFDMASHIDKSPRKFYCYEIEPEIMLILFELSKNYEKHMGFHCSYKTNENGFMESGKNHTNEENSWKKCCKESYKLNKLIECKLPNAFNKIDKRFKYIGYVWYASLLGKYS